MFVLPLLILVGAHVPNIWAFDIAYSQLEVGDPGDRIVEIFGSHPTETHTIRDHGRRYVYRVYPLLLGPNLLVRTQWVIVVDQTNRIVWKNRSDDAC